MTSAIGFLVRPEMLCRTGCLSHHASVLEEFIVREVIQDLDIVIIETDARMALENGFRASVSIYLHLVQGVAHQYHRRLVKEGGRRPRAMFSMLVNSPSLWTRGFQSINWPYY